MATEAFTPAFQGRGLELGQTSAACRGGWVTEATPRVDCHPEVVVLDEHLRVRGFTPAAGELLALEPGDTGRPPEFLAAAPADRSMESIAWKVLAGAAEARGVLRARDGRGLPAVLAPLLTGSDGARGVVVALVTDAARPNEQTDADRAWDELAQLVAAAAHDLRGPLGTIRGFCRVLERRAADRRDAESRAGLERIETAATRTLALVDGLLRVARVCAEPLELLPTDMNRVAESVVEDLHAEIAAHGARVAWVALPTVRGSEKLLRQLLRSLIENALEYRTDATPRASIEAEQVGAEWQFSVRDNGVGIAPEHHQRIFEVFRRLDPGRSPGRAGVGLTIAKRVVERHGGRIWVDSAPGSGSTFFFTLPASSPSCVAEAQA